jgi:hypothetical protein
MSGLLFGYLFGLVWSCTLFAVLGEKEISTYLIFGSMCFAVFWSVFWGLSGGLCLAIPGHPGTIASVLAIVCGHWYVIATSTVGGWWAITLPINSFVAAFPCHWLLMLLAGLCGRIK